MSQRHSEYELVPGDSYYTPAWVTEALLSIELFPQNVWDPASGEGHMARALNAKGYFCAASDISHGVDFLQTPGALLPARAIITNPPYSNGLAEKFVRQALKITAPRNPDNSNKDGGKVAMLLPHAWDTAKGRRDLFAEHPAFKAKYTLTRRIRWVNLEQKANGPSSNHAWFVWDWKHSGPPTLGYLP